MPRKRSKRIACTYYVWNLVQREEVFYADGRSNSVNRRFTLSTRDREEALRRLPVLDHKMAVEHGQATAHDAPATASNLVLPLEVGRERYDEHVRRPAIAGGASKATQKRYRAVFDKFVPFAKKQGVECWSAVNRRLLERYAGWLDSKTYAYRTEYLELTMIKQCVRWLAREGLLPIDSIIDMPLKKASGTDTYCWTQTEVRAMRERCSQNSELAWLHGVVVGLACTGLRISELASLKWSDIDLAAARISLTDESKSANKKKKSKRTTKTGHSRTFPIHPELRAVLNEIPRHADGLVFHGPKNGKLKPDTVRIILVRDVLKPLASQFPTADDEIGFRDGRLHSFRHYFCSMCANRNVPEQLLMSWLGHRQSAMVKHYYHVDHNEAARQMSGLDLV